MQIKFCEKPDASKGLSSKLLRNRTKKAGLVFKKRCYATANQKSILLTMKLTTLFLFFGCLHVFGRSNAQMVTLSLHNAAIEKVFTEIQKQTDFNFVYNNQLINKAKRVNVHAINASIETVMEQCFKDQPLTYLISDKTIIIKPKDDLQVRIQNVSVTKTLVIDVHGNITNEKGEPLEGVSVRVKNTTKGTVTDAAGHFALSVTAEETQLEISAVGYNPQTVEVRNNPSISIVLQQKSAAMEQVVVVGYGQQKRINLTGSVVSVDAGQIENRGAANVSNLIAGQAPGVTVLQRGGPPGRDAGTINIRGIGTLGSSNPLIIVDGIETTDYTQINPNDIASVSILKDASSSAIYGINGANGVIIITTKRGVKGKVKMNYDLQAGGSAFNSLPDKVNSFELATLYDEAQTNDGTPAASLKFSQGDLQKFKDGSSPLTHANSNWVKAVFSQPGTWLSHNLSLSGGTEDTRYNVSLGYLDQGGIMNNTGYKRYTFRTNFDQRISSRLTTGFNLSITNRDVTDPPTVSGVGGETWYLHQAFQSWATDVIQFPDGHWAYPTWSGQNHNAVAYTSKENGYSKNNDTRFMGTAFAEFTIIKGLTIKGIAANTRDYNYASNLGLGVDLYTIDPATGVISTTPNNAASIPAVTATRSVYRGFLHSNDVNLQGLLTYEKKLAKHEIKLLGGYQQRAITTESESITRTNLSDPSLTQIDAADPTNQITSGNTIDFRSKSFFGRLNYIYDNKYLVEANVRHDGTSRFAPDNRTAVFPSFAAGWIISNERFFNVPIVSLLKIRASWGVLGNQEIGDYQFLSTYTLGSSYLFDGTRYTGINEGGLANAKTTWEKTTSKNIGFDVGMFHNKLTLSADLFSKETKDILLALQQPSILGATPPLVNAGTVKNTGFEVTAGYKNRSGNVGYYINGNFAKVRNKITDLAGTEYPGREVGDPIDNLYGYVAEGLFQAQADIAKHADQSSIGTPSPGDIMYKDLNGDNKIDENDRTNLGSFFPAINYGVSFGVDYKGFDLSSLWQGVAQVKTLLTGRLVQPFGTFGSSPIKEQLDRWTPDGSNPGARFPRMSFNTAYNYVPSSWWVFNTSFLKLRNIQLGYTLRAAIATKIKMSRVRVYVSGENLLTISPFKLLDPETVTMGDPFFGYGGYGAYPTTRRILGGISLTF